MMSIAKVVSSLKSGAQSMQPRGFNRAEVMLNNSKEANLFLDSPALPNRRSKRRAFSKAFVSTLIWRNLWSSLFLHAKSPLQNV